MSSDKQPYVNQAVESSETLDFFSQDIESDNVYYRFGPSNSVRPKCRNDSANYAALLGAAHKHYVAQAPQVSQDTVKRSSLIPGIPERDIALVRGLLDGMNLNRGGRSVRRSAG